MSDLSTSGKREFWTGTKVSPLRVLICLFLTFSLFNLIPLTHFGFPLEWNKNHSLFYLAGHLLFFLATLLYSFGSARAISWAFLSVTSLIHLVMIAYYLAPLWQLRSIEPKDELAHSYQIEIPKSKLGNKVDTNSDVVFLAQDLDQLASCNDLAFMGPQYIVAFEASYNEQRYCLFLSAKFELLQSRILGEFLPPSVIINFLDSETGRAGLLGFFVAPELNSIEHYHQSRHLSRRLATILRHDRSPGIFIFESPSTPYTTYFKRLIESGRLKLVVQNSVLEDLFLPGKLRTEQFSLFCRGQGCQIRF